MLRAYVDRKLGKVRVTAGRLAHDSRKSRESVRKKIGEKTANAIEVRDGHQCVYCKKSKDKSTPPPFTFDHLTPRARGGKDVPKNLVLACKPCNSARHDKSLAQWSRERGARYGFHARDVRNQARRVLR